MADLLLASASPRRRELLEQIGVNFISEAQDIDESVQVNETPSQYVQRLACEKAEKGCKAYNMTALGSDTCVVLDGEILSKPVSVEDATAMLGRLAGRNHQVLTGIAICEKVDHQFRVSSQVVSTDVSFTPLTKAQIERYVATGEPMDKAGSYGIQGKAAVFVSGIKGSYSNVVGLPLMETAQLLQQHNIPVWCVE